MAQTQPYITLTLETTAKRTTFRLLEIDPMQQFATMPISKAAYERGLNLRTAAEELTWDCGRNLPEIMPPIEKYTIHKLTTDENGKGELRNLKPGHYWLFGRSGTGEGCALWVMKVELKESQTVKLDGENRK